jgi:hypothetical protein
MKIKLVSFLIVMILLTACSKSLVTKEKTVEHRCIESGGKMLSVGLLGTSECIIEHNDANKPCTSSDECEGDCIITPELQERGSETGICKHNTNRFGCFSSIEDYKKNTAIICTD